MSTARALALTDIPQVETVETTTTLTLRPGDVLVCVTREGSTQYLQELIAEALRQAFPSNQVLILPYGTQLSVIRADVNRLTTEAANEHATQGPRLPEAGESDPRSAPPPGQGHRDEPGWFAPRRGGDPGWAQIDRSINGWDA